MLDQIFINVGHLYKFPSQNINMHVYEHRQAVDMAGLYWLGNNCAGVKLVAGKGDH